MSSMEHKVEVIGEFLENRAELQRVTGFEEIQRVAGKSLAEKGYRASGYSGPVSREDVATTLEAIALDSYLKSQILLPAIVVKFWSNEPVHEFASWASVAGLMEGTLGECEQGPVRDKINELAPGERVKVFLAYTQPVDVDAAS